jgi:hypothetical protein
LLGSVLVQCHRARQRRLELTDGQRGFKRPLAIPALSADEKPVRRAAARAREIGGNERQGVSARIAQERTRHVAAGALRSEDELDEAVEQTHFSPRSRVTGIGTRVTGPLAKRQELRERQGGDRRHGRRQNR